MIISEILISDLNCRRYTGLSFKNFYHFVNKIALQIKRTNLKRKTKNKPGAGRPCKLNLAERVWLELTN